MTRVMNRCRRLAAMLSCHGGSSIDTHSRETSRREASSSRRRTNDSADDSDEDDGEQQHGSEDDEDQQDEDDSGEEEQQEFEEEEEQQDSEEEEQSHDKEEGQQDEEDSEEEEQQYDEIGMSQIGGAPEPTQASQHAARVRKRKEIFSPEGQRVPQPPPRRTAVVKRPSKLATKRGRGQ